MVDFFTISRKQDYPGAECEKLFRSLSIVCLRASFTKKGLRFLLGMSKTLICSQ